MALCQISGLFTLRLSAFINAVLPLTLLFCRGYTQEVPTKQVVALLGDDVVLPCSLGRPVDASHLQLEWARAAEKVKRSCIHLIVASASTLVIKVMSDVSSSRVVLQCESAGWYPEPELLWLVGEGKLLSAGPTETLRGPDDLYTVSSRVTVEKRHSNNITCRVQQRNTNQSRETHIHVAGDVIREPRLIVFPIIFFACVVFLVVAFLRMLKQTQSDDRNNETKVKEERRDLITVEVEGREKT